jgi:hypothetical protein
LENFVFFNVTPCGSCNNRRSRRTYRLHHQGENTVIFRSVLRLPVNGNIGFFHPNDGAICSSETLVLTRATRRQIEEEGILHSHRREKPQILRRNGLSALLVDSATDGIENIVSIGITSDLYSAGA